MCPDSIPGLYVSLEFTPNPNTLKYSVNRELLGKVNKAAVNFTRKEEADRGSPLAAKLFSVPGIAAVMIGRDFITVTKEEEGDWDVVHKNSSSLIESHLREGLEVLSEVFRTEETNAHKGGDSDIENKIREILDNEIRPAVAMDGGDITFERYEEGIVYLYLQGSCSGCPSSTATLKMGIETRLREVIPEIQEVVSV